MGATPTSIAFSSTPKGVPLAVNHLPVPASAHRSPQQDRLYSGENGVIYHDKACQVYPVARAGRDVDEIHSLLTYFTVWAL
jgi:hypothetical protein